MLMHALSVEQESVMCDVASESVELSAASLSHLPPQPFPNLSLLLSK